MSDNIKNTHILHEGPDKYYITFDLEKMKKAVESPSISIPQGLTSEEILDFLLGIDTNEKT